MVLESTPTLSDEPVSCSQFGKTLQLSGICPLCKSSKRNDINLLRSYKHMSYKAIAEEIHASEKDVIRHFTNHYIVNADVGRLLSAKENTSPAMQEIIANVFNGDNGIIEASSSVISIKCNRLISMLHRLQELNAELETNDMTYDDDGHVVFGKDENYKNFIKINDAATKLENSILEAYKIIDNKLFSVNQNELQKAILNFKLDYLQKVLDRFVVIFNTYMSKGDIYAQVIRELKYDLAQQFNFMELELVRSGAATSMVLEQEVKDGEVVNTPVATETLEDEWEEKGR